MIRERLRNVNVSPSIGLFVADTSSSTQTQRVDIKTGDESATCGLPSSSRRTTCVQPLMFAFGGIGYRCRVRVASSVPVLAVAPRIGMNFMFGRSGFLTPSVSYEYTTHDVDSVERG